MKTRLAVALAAPLCLASTAAAQVATTLHVFTELEELFAVDDAFALIVGDEGKGRGIELYRWDASAGVELLAEPTPGAGDSFFRGFTNAWLGGERVTFFLVDRGLNAELWRTDGTEAGTTQVSDFGYTPQDEALLGGALHFNARAGQLFLSIASTSGTQTGLWASDGTPGGTVLVAPHTTAPRGLTSLGPDLFYSLALQPTVQRFNPSTGQGATVATLPGAFVYDLARIGDELAVAVGMDFDVEQDSEFWRVDPGGEAASKVLDFNPGTWDTVDFLGRSERTGELYLTAQTPAGKRVFRSDLTAAGTVAVSAPFSGTYFDFVSPDLVGNGKALLQSNVTATKALQVIDTLGHGAAVDLGVKGSQHYPYKQAAVFANGGTYFMGESVAKGKGLFFTDGTKAGTTQLYSTITVPSAMFDDLVLCDGRVLFDARIGANFEGLVQFAPPGAYAAELGTYGGTPRLRATDPILGSPVQMSGEGAQPGSVGVLAYSLPPAAPLDLGTGVPLWVDPNMAFLVPGLLTPTWTRALPLPNAPSLTGAKFNLQAWFIDPLTGALEGSNALRMNLAP